LQLLLSEIEFLTNHYERDLTVVYAGAAPGRHTNFLAAALFPKLKFILIDPSNFDAWETSRLTIRQEFFTDNTAREFGGRSDILFISDVRTHMAWGEAREEGVLEDMMMQMKWVKMMRPKAAMLKFCLPYDHDKIPMVRYLDGSIHLPIWGPRTTSETRLIVVDPDSERNYDTRDYDDAMFHFNTVTRVSHYQHQHQAGGYDHCYDCTAEGLVLQEYLRKLERIRVDGLLVEGADKLADMLSRNISNFRKSLNTSEWVAPNEKGPVDQREEEDQ